jgi:hypothetical protein
VLSLLDAQIEWTEAERFPHYSGTWHGPQAVLDNLLKPLAGDWDGFSAKAHEFIAEGDRVVRLGPIPERSRKPADHYRPAFAHGPGRPRRLGFGLRQLNGLLAAS